MADVEELTANTDGALDLVDEELERSGDEEQAFLNFRKQIVSLDVSTSVTGSPGLVTQTNGIFGNTTTRGIDRVEDAYRDTVMSVPHYEEEYDESLPTNMGEYLGEGVAMVFDSAEELTPPLLGALSEKCGERINELRGLRKSLDSEYDSLKTVRRGIKDIFDRATSLGPVERLREHDHVVMGDLNIDGLAEAYQSLEDMETELCRMSTERMENVDRLSKTPLHQEPGDTGIYRYLYRDLGTYRPALKDCNHLGIWIYQCRKKISRTVWSIESERDPG